MENVKNVIAYLNLLLRYVTSGIVGVLIYAYVNEYRLSAILTGRDNSVLVIVGTICGLIGLIAYGIHHSLLDKLMYKMSIYFYTKYNRLPVQLCRGVVRSSRTMKASGWQRQKIGLIAFELISQTYLRKSCEDKRVSKLQKQIDANLAMLNFMYCTILFSVVMPLYKWSPFWYYHNFHITFREIVILSFLAVMIITAISWDFYITKRELWVVKNFYQEK